MGKFGHALPGLHFGKFTPTMLAQKHCNKPGLYQKNRDDGCNLPRIPFPNGWLSEVDGAAGRQIAFADPKPLQLSPVEPWSRELNRPGLYVANRILSGERAGDIKTRPIGFPAPR